MGKRVANPDECFVYWYNGGDRRTKGETAEHFGVHRDTVSNYAREFDWEGLADAADVEKRQMLSRKLASMNAKALEQELSLLLSVEARFSRRIPKLLEDGSPNPDYLPAAEMSVGDLVAAIKARLQIAEGIREPVVVGGEQRPKTLEEIEAEIAALDAAEQKGDG